MSQSPGFPSTWVAGAGTAHRVPDIGPAVFPWLLFHELQLNAAQPYLLYQECREREGQQGLGRESLWVCHGAVEGSAHVPWCCGIALPSSAELAPVGEGGMSSSCPPEAPDRGPKRYSRPIAGPSGLPFLQMMPRSRAHRLS